MGQPLDQLVGRNPALLIYDFSVKSRQSCGSNMLKGRVDRQNPCWDS